MYKRQVLRAPLHGLPEAPVTVRITVCPSAVGLVRQTVLNFMNECSDWVGSVRLSVEVRTVVPVSVPARKLTLSPSQKKARATRTTETRQNLTNDFITSLPPESYEYTERQVLPELVPEYKLSGFESGVRRKPEGLTHDRLAENGRESVRVKVQNQETVLWRENLSDGCLLYTSPSPRD